MYQPNSFYKGAVFHLCNKSISGYGIFKDYKNILRFLKVVYYLNSSQKAKPLSQFLRGVKNSKAKVNLLIPKKDNLFKLIAYSIMPDHYHLLIRVLTDHSLSKYISDVENSFSRYFNIRFKRKGPIWQSRFRSVEIKTDEQLLHVSRYIHLNPVTDYLVNKPEDWKFSSYREYIDNEKLLNEVMTEITIKDTKKYKEFCENQIDYQRNLKKIKKLLLE